MERTTHAVIGLGVFTAGIFLWIFPNASLGQVPNAVTDVVIVVGGVLAAVGLPRAVEGIGTGPLRWGLSIVAIAQLGQNLVTVATGLSPTNAAPASVVMLGALSVFVGVRRWQEDGWDLAAVPWLMAGFAAFAFEPLYYFVLGAVNGSFFGPYSPGAWLVAIGAGLASFSFRPQGLEPGIRVPPGRTA